MLAPLDLQQYIVSNIAWFNATHPWRSAWLATPGVSNSHGSGAGGQAGHAPGYVQAGEPE